jgi:hypothetical protein
MVGWTIFGAWVGGFSWYVVPLGAWNCILGGMIAVFVASLSVEALFFSSWNLISLASHAPSSTFSF